MRTALTLLVALSVGACTSREVPTAATVAVVPASLRIAPRNFAVGQSAPPWVKLTYEVRNANGDLLPHARATLTSRNPAIVVFDSADGMARPPGSSGEARLVASIASWPGTTLYDSVTIAFVCDAGFSFYLRINFVDSLTNAFGPFTNTSIVARSGDFVDSKSYPSIPASATTNGMVTAGERAGTYDLTVKAEGYRDWTKTVLVPQGVCHAIPVAVTARLQKP